MAGRGVTVDFNANIARFTSSVDKMSNDLAKFQTNASRVSKNIDKSFSSIAFGIKGAFGGIATALSVRELATMADSFNNIQARLKLATRDANEFAEANENIKRIAESSKTSLESTATLYTRISQSLLDVGGTQAQVAATTQALALSLRLSGASASESASVMQQFSQAIGSGTLRAEEFNAVNEAGPRAMKAFAAALGVPIGQLRKMAEAGQLTRDVLVNSLGSQLPKLIQEAETLPNTIESAFQSAKNELLLTVGAIDQVTGASSRAANLIAKMVGGIKNLRDAVGENNQDSLISDRLRETQQLMDSALKVRQLFNSLGLKPPSGASDSYINDLNRQAIELKKNLEKLREVPAAGTNEAEAASKRLKDAVAEAEAAKKREAAEKARKEAAEAAKKAMESLRKEGASLAASVDPIVNRNQELAKYVELLQKGAISQQTFDLAATKSITTAQAALDSVDQSLIAAKQAQEALDALTKEGESLKLAVDPFYKLNKEVERYSELLEKGVIDQRTFELAVEKSTGKSAEVVKEEVDKMTAAAIGFQTNVQNHLGNSLYQALSGDFQNIGQLWKQMLARMLADAVAANLSSAIFGENGKGGLLKGGLSILSSLFGSFGGPKAGALGSSTFGQSFWPIPKFAIGGDFGGGMRLVGERGPELEVTGPSRIFNANQTKDILNGGNGRSVVVNYSPSVHIDSRSDRASIIQDMQRINKQGQAELVDRLQRDGIL